MTTESEIVTLIKDLVAIPSINPESKQEGLPETYYGEAKKVEYIKKYLTKIGVPPAYMREVNVKDERVPTGSRPTVFVTIPGDVPHKRELIVLGHTDVVPPGDLDKWQHPPLALLFATVEYTGGGLLIIHMLWQLCSLLQNDYSLKVLHQKQM
jgi:succinyl-diaminopimelate desuccinylase